MQKNHKNKELIPLLLEKEEDSEDVSEQSKEWHPIDI